MDFILPKTGIIAPNPYCIRILRKIDKMSKVQIVDFFLHFDLLVD
jgi:hypothetical protein